MTTTSQSEKSAAAAAYSGPSRHRTSSALVAALVCFFLPWVSVSCGETVSGGQKTEHFTVTQSGFQAIYGGFSVRGGAKSEEEVRAKNKSRESLGIAPLLALYGLLLFSSLVVNYWIYKEVVRLNIILAFTCAALLICLVAPVPLAARVARQPKEDLYPLYVEVQYTIWYWLALAATAGSMLLAGWERLVYAGRE